MTEPNLAYIAALDTEADVEAAAHDLEARRLASHVAFKREGMAIAARRNELVAAGQVGALSPENRAALRSALDAADEVI